jgi:hypothetical protein
MSNTSRNEPNNAARPPFKPGDWLLYEWELAFVREVENGRVTHVVTDFFSHGGNNLDDQCVMLTARNNAVSSNFRDLSRRLHAIKGQSLNYPDLHRWLVDLWVTACHHENSTALVHAQEGVANIERRCQDLRFERVEGVDVAVFGRR